MTGAAPQIVVVHLSDLHFGSGHRFDPPITPAGDRPKREGYPTMLDKLQEDWSAWNANCPVLVCITGDLTTTASDSEFDQAIDFINKLDGRTIFGSKVSRNEIFAVPGNHDVIYEGSSDVERMKSWVDFFNESFGTRLTKKEHRKTTTLYDRIDDLGVVILTLNSSMHVQKGQADQDRGQIDVMQLKAIQNQLAAIKPERLHRAIRIALLHHHPVLIPPLAEPGRGYDAVHNSGKLLTMLRRYGFHAVLHGHKHNPHTFTDDTRSAFAASAHRPLFVVAGGSVGSVELPDLPRKSNCYNIITIKWHPDAAQSRIRVQTRGLSVFDDDRTEKLPQDWSWIQLDENDKSFFGDRRLPESAAAQQLPFTDAIHGLGDKDRRNEYKRLRGNMPVVEVLPSLEKGQAYEARLWIVQHPNGPAELPEKVRWLAGSKFPIVEVLASEDPHFCASVSYWGPMLVRVELLFADKTMAAFNLYARMPCTYPLDEEIR